jgi:hypothetical protein
MQLAEKHVMFSLLKNVQMQGTRNFGMRVTRVFHHLNTRQAADGRFSADC